jgi:RNA polymerase sigma-70 factor (ECF subfamily)
MGARRARDKPLNISRAGASTACYGSTLLDKLDERELVERAAEDDHRAFQVLVERYQRKAYTVAFGILRSEDAAMDVTQDAFVKVYKSLPRFKGQAAFYTWLYRIVVNLCIDRKRKSARRAEVAYEDTYTQGDATAVAGPVLASTGIESPSAAYARRELREQMGQAMDTLSERHREILVLREVEGLSYEELSDVLEVPKGTIMSRLFHARKNFQLALGQYLTT